MVGRSHGIHAEPITFGFKAAGWLAELQRDAVRLARAREVVSVGSISGAVGTHANVSAEVEAHVLAGLASSRTRPRHRSSAATATPSCSLPSPSWAARWSGSPSRSGTSSAPRWARPSSRSAPASRDRARCPTSATRSSPSA